MKLPIKHKYFQQIKSGAKKFEFRDAHITFVDETTKETLTKKVWGLSLQKRIDILRDFPDTIDVLSDDEIIVFNI